MKKIILVFISSFFVGMATGAYIYVTKFHPTFMLEHFSFDKKETVLPGDLPTDDGFVISGDSYGVCSRTNNCVSYIISSNGSFTYKGEQDNDGVIDSGLKEEINARLAATEADLPDTNISGQACPMVENQNEFSYIIKYKNKTYKLDTCHDIFDDQSDLGQLLTDFWDILPTL